METGLNLMEIEGKMNELGPSISEWSVSEGFFFFLVQQEEGGRKAMAASPSCDSSLLALL